MSNDSGGRSGDFSSRPVPDPTLLTTEQLLREVETLRRELLGLRELFETWLQGQEKISDEKFRSIELRLQLVEHQRIEQKEDTKAAVDAALIAQKEAVKEQTIASEKSIGKSEAATTKQLDQQALTFAQSIKGVTDTLNDLKGRDLADLKDRMGRMESIRQGGKETTANFGQVWGIAVSAILALVGIAALVISLQGGT